jgi:hypothetical protein
VHVRQCALVVVTLRRHGLLVLLLVLLLLLVLVLLLVLLLLLVLVLLDGCGPKGHSCSTGSKEAAAAGSRRS